MKTKQKIDHERMRTLFCNKEVLNNLIDRMDRVIVNLRTSTAKDCKEELIEIRDDLWDHLNAYDKDRSARISNRPEEQENQSVLFENSDGADNEKRETEIHPEPGRQVVGVAAVPEGAEASDKSNKFILFPPIENGKAYPPGKYSFAGFGGILISFQMPTPFDVTRDCEGGIIYLVIRRKGYNEVLRIPEATSRWVPD